MIINMPNICLACIEDKEIKKLLNPKSNLERCTYCNNVAFYITVEELAKVIDPFLRKYYSCCSETIPVFNNDTGKLYYELSGEPLFLFLNLILKLIRACGSSF